MSKGHASPSLRRPFRETLDVIVTRDPSVPSRTEALLHPTVLTPLGYRTSNFPHRYGRCLTARLVCSATKVLTGGIEIHPGAQIGRRFFVDHGSRVVVGAMSLVLSDVPEGAHVRAPQAVIGHVSGSRAAAGRGPGTHAAADHVRARHLPARTPLDGPRPGARLPHRNGSERTHES